MVATGWLATNSVFEHRPEQRLGFGLGASLLLHGCLLGVILLIYAFVPKENLDALQNQIVHLVYMQQPGPGGGGGGSPAPAPAKQMEVPKAKMAEPIPVTPPPPVPPPPDPIPQLVAPVMTNNANVIQATGASSVSLAAYAGGGRGGGLGEGRGAGVGAGEGGGEGGGIYRPGNGIVNPYPLKEVKPAYTAEAMRLKIQGKVVMEAVLKEDGTIGDVKIIKSLDRASGLDDEAIKAARQWLFKPATRQGKAVALYIQMELEFRLH